MKLNPDLQLRNIGNRHIIVNIADGADNKADVFTLNDTAALLWEEARRLGDFDAANLADFLCREFDVDDATARADVDALLDLWRSQGLATE